MGLTDGMLEIKGGKGGLGKKVEVGAWVERDWKWMFDWIGKPDMDNGPIQIEVA